MNVRVKAGGLLALCLVMSGTVGCKKKSEGRTSHRTVKASVATFDPEGDVELDLNKWGTERADEWMVQEAFNQSFAGLDQCLIDFKEAKGLPPEKQLSGGLEVAVKLNPAEPRPFAVNATISNEKLDGQEELKDCIREAVASVQFPTYDGPPQVASFSVDQLDPGFEYIEE